MFRTIVSLALILAPTLVHAAESDFTVPWDVFNMDVQSAADTRLLASGFADGSCVVDANSDPANPFSDVTHALYVTSDDKWFRLHFRPFEGPPVETGALAMQFQIEENSVSLQVGANESPWASSDRDGIVIDHPYLNVNFCLDNGISIQGRSLRTHSVERLEAGHPYTFVIKWDFTQGVPLCTFYLNGEPLQRNSGEVFSWKITEPGSEPGINSFRITLGTGENPRGKFFLGRLQGSKDAGDLWSEDWP